jgi:hypothetical protein
MERSRISFLTQRSLPIHQALFFRYNFPIRRLGLPDISSSSLHLTQNRKKSRHWKGNISLRIQNQKSMQGLAKQSAVLSKYC